MDKAQVRNLVNYANVGEAIDHELAAKMVKDYQDMHNDATAGFVIGKSIIEKILGQPGCVAIRFHNAIDENNKRTLVYGGVDANGDTIVEYPIVDSDGKLGRVEALIGDRTMGGDGTLKNWFGS